MQETWVQSLGWEDPLEEGMATHSTILAWRIPMDRGAWWAIVHGVAKGSDVTERRSTSTRGVVMGQCHVASAQVKVPLQVSRPCPKLRPKISWQQHCLQLGRIPALSFLQGAQFTR